MKTISIQSNRRLSVIATALFFCAMIWALGINAQSSFSPVKTDIEEAWTRTELYFGAGSISDADKPDERWENYINDIVTPRFPEGLTLLEGTGQWRVKPDQKPRRHRTRILILIHKDTPEKSKQVDEIRSLWREISGHQSVLRVSQPAKVSF